MTGAPALRAYRLKRIHTGWSFATFVAVEYDVLILGRGIAGAVLAETCQLRGLSFHVIDHKRRGNATMAAGGAVNPVILRRDILCWRGAEFMSAARSFYRAWDRRNGTSSWEDLPLVKLFASAAAADHWHQTAADPGRAPYFSTERPAVVDAAPLMHPFGYGLVPGAARLDMAAFLETQRHALLAMNRLTEHDVAEAEVRIEPHGVRIGSLGGSLLVRCTGPFHGIGGLSLVKGESLLVHIPGMRLHALVHGGIGMLPAGGELWGVGSTFKWNDIWEGPTETARRWMLDRVADMTSAQVEVVDHRAGVRPAARDRKPLLGRTGQHQAVFNGLGARGAMQAPWCAAHLLDHLFNGAPLDPEVDCARYA